MVEEERMLVDVGMTDLPFPIEALSQANPDGQNTVASVPIKARILHDFEALWIDKFVQALHSHRDTIGTATPRRNIPAYMKELGATAVRSTSNTPSSWRSRPRFPG